MATAPESPPRIHRHMGGSDPSRRRIRRLPGGGGPSRRRFLGGMAAVAASGVVAACSKSGGDSGSSPTTTLDESRLERTTAQVAVLGGGVGGMTAAHELAERGFEVVLYETRPSLGGRSRSIWVPESATDDRLPLPGEHGFRFFPGFYQHIPDTMSRIPFEGNTNGVFDNLTVANQVSFSRAGGVEDVVLPVSQLPMSIFEIQDVIGGIFTDLVGLSAEEVEFFSRQMAIFLSSSDDRRYGEFESMDWLDFIGADRFSDDYVTFLGVGATRNFVAARAEEASARTIALILGQFLYNLAGEGEPLDQVLNGPTDLAWLDPWRAELERLGVELRTEAYIEELAIRDGRVDEVLIRHADHDEVLSAKWVVCALPLEVARSLWNEDVLAAAPGLADTFDLRSEQMSGIQYFLRDEVPIIRGHLSYVDSPWALTSISQQQFWPDHPMEGFGDGEARDVLSVDISNWDEPGILFDKPARACSPQEISEETWAQMKANLEDTGDDVLDEPLMHSWYLDPSPDEGLLVNTAGSWFDRPAAVPSIPNLFLASDYVRTSIDLATMEGANEAGRMAANGILDASGSDAEPVDLFELYESPEFDELKRDDAERYARGESHFLSGTSG